MSAIPPKFKPLTPFIKRAEELDRDDSGRVESKVVAYYCRMHAVELGMGLPDKSPDDDRFLIALLDQLEKDKRELPPDAINGAQGICRQFAMDVFQRADDEDSQSLADNTTARAFHAAGTFFDILAQFKDAPMDQECVIKKKYAKAKAMDILKAIKAGRTPTPGLDGQMVDTSGIVADPPQSAPPPAAADTYSPPAAPTPAPPPQSYPAASAPVVAPQAPVDVQPQPPVYVQPAPAPVAPVAPVRPPPSASVPAAPATPTQPYAPSPSPPAYSPPAQPKQVVSVGGKGSANATMIADAMEYTRFAMSALDHKDINLAKQRLQAALDCLR